LVGSRAEEDGSWDVGEEELRGVCGGTANGSGIVYGIVNVGLWVQMFRAEGGRLERLSGRLHLKDDVGAVMEILDEVRRTPMPV
jgi:hypothetical protein